MTRPNPTQKCTNSPHSGSVGCQPPASIFSLANEYAKGKMFWNPPLFDICSSMFGTGYRNMSELCFYDF